MKKFENPIINVSLFDVENIVTTSTGGDNPTLPSALDEAKSQALSIAGNDAAKAITITF